MRSFSMERRADESGISGTGIVVEGVEFSDGRIAVRWVGRGDDPVRSTVVYDSVEDFFSIHVYSHPTNGTVVRFSDGLALAQDDSGRLVPIQKACKFSWPGQSKCEREPHFCISPDCLMEII